MIQMQVFTWSSTVLNLLKNTDLIVDWTSEKRYFFCFSLLHMTVLFLEFLHSFWLEVASFISSKYILALRNVTEHKCHMWTSIVWRLVFLFFWVFFLLGLKKVIDNTRVTGFYNKELECWNSVEQKYILLHFMPYTYWFLFLWSDNRST